MLRFLATALSSRRPIALSSRRRGARPQLELLENRLTPSTILVDDDRVQAPKAAFTSIQAAINAAKPGDEIRVYPGTYVEQLTIGAGKNNIEVESATSTKPLLVAPATLTGNGALIDITGSQNVEIERLTLKGNANTKFGIRVSGGASADIENNTISGILDPNGAGIYVGRSSATDTSSGKAEVENNNVSNYGKVGIAFDGAKYKGEIENNTVVGSGDNPNIAQNGIQVSGGANVEVERNDVSGNRYTGTGFDAAGILLDAAGSKTEVERNTVHDNQEGILVSKTKSVEIESNRSYKNTEDGITLVDSSDIDIDCNETDHNGGDGISVYGDPGVASGNNRIAHSSSHDNTGNGIYLETTSKNTVVGNTTNSNGANGILLKDADKGIVAGNTATKNKLSGIALTAGSDSNLVAANVASKERSRRHRDSELGPQSRDAQSHRFQQPLRHLRGRRHRRQHVRQQLVERQQGRGFLARRPPQKPEEARFRRLFQVVGTSQLRLR